jgi:predicted  nucleic acid-binding Zn-ribbon protein
MDGVTKSLECILTILKSKGMTRKSAVTRTPQTHHLSNTYGNVGPESPQMETMRRRLDIEKERDGSGREQHPSADENPRASESTSSPSLRERRRRSFVGDVTTTQPQSSVSQSPNSGYFPSPMQVPLPNMRAPSSGSSLGFSGNPMLPPISPSSQPSQSQAALAAHLSDLQHQVGTKSFALQTLQTEHDRLRSAYQRSQMRCATLEKKFQVSDAEINNLTEERNRLQTQCEAFEKQVEDLLEQRDAANKMSIAGGGQYTSIIQQANLLESQTLTTRKKWKAEKEEWERQKEEMEQRIKQLEMDREGHVPDGSAEASLKPQSPPSPRTRDLPGHPGDLHKLSLGAGDIILSSNPDDLRHEIVRLRHRTNDLDRSLQELKSDGQSIDQLVRGLAAASRRMVARADAAAATAATPEGAGATADV